MFISKLADKIAQYDRYGESRANGIKAVFLAELMFGFNAIFSIPHPYFYYFFVPLNMILAENLGTDLKEKYLFFILAMLSSASTIFGFYLLSSFKVIFLVFVFAYSLGLYYLFLSKFKKVLLLAPFILSMGAYSLEFVQYHDFYTALNHILVGLLAMMIMLVGLWLFPKTYYLGIWRRAFIELMSSIHQIASVMLSSKSTTMPVVPSILIMKQYAKMLPKTMRNYSVLKINFLGFDLLMQLAYHASLGKAYTSTELVLLKDVTADLSQAVKHKQAVLMLPELRASHSLRFLYRLVLSWNYLCNDTTLKYS